MPMLILAQSMTPTDAVAWATAIERGGIVGLLVLFIIAFAVALRKQWLVTGNVVSIYERRVAQLEAREEKLLDLALKGARISETAVTTLQQQRG